MKKIIILCCVVLCAISTVHAQKWHTDFEEAKKVALEKNRKIIVVFQGSDWNGLCIRLNKEMWTNPESTSKVSCLEQQDIKRWRRISILNCLISLNHNMFRLLYLKSLVERL